MTPTTLPTKPVDNWEQVRDEWIAALDQLCRQLESWAQKQNWATLRGTNTVEESRLGAYEAPRLLIHTFMGRVLLTPGHRFVPGVLGLAELAVYPSYNSVLLVRTDDGWFIHPDIGEEKRLPLTEQAFLDTIHQLLRAA